MGGLLYSSGFDIIAFDTKGVLGTTPWKMIGQSHHFKQSPTFQSCLTSASRATRKNIASNMGGFPYNSGFDIIAFEMKGVLHSG